MSRANPHLVWSAHPLRERRVQAVVGIVTILLMGALAAFLGDAWVWFPVSCAVLVIALNRFFFPSTFTIDARGIHAKYPLGTKNLAWSDLRTFRFDAHGAYLSSRVRVGVFDTRGMHVLLGSRPDDVLDAIRLARSEAQATGIGEGSA